MAKVTKDWETLLEHELAKMLPLMPDAEFQALKGDIAENGLKEPIMLFQNKILDGRHRFRACKLLRDEKKLLQPPAFEHFKGSETDARHYVASLNMLRRHLSKSQKAMVLVMAGFVAPPGGSGRRRKYGTGRDAIMEVGRKYGVNHVTLYKAAYVHDRDPKLAQEVAAGRQSVPAAEKTIRDREEPQGAGSTAETRPKALIMNEIRSLKKLLASIERKLKADDLPKRDSLAAWAVTRRAVQEFFETLLMA